MADAVNTLPMPGINFTAEFEAFAKMVEISRDLLAESIGDAGDTKTPELVLSVLDGAVQLSERAAASYKTMAHAWLSKTRWIEAKVAENEEVLSDLNERTKDLGSFAGPMDIATRAIEVDVYARAEQYAKEALHEAYDEFKREAEIDHVERDSSDWDLMMEATKPEYEVLQKAKRDHRNARRRLETAIRRHRLNSFSRADIAA